MALDWRAFNRQCQPARIHARIPPTGGGNGSLLQVHVAIGCGHHCKTPLKKLGSRLCWKASMTQRVVGEVVTVVLLVFNEVIGRCITSMAAPL